MEEDKEEDDEGEEALLPIEVEEQPKKRNQNGGFRYILGKGYHRIYRMLDPTNDDGVGWIL